MLDIKLIRENPEKINELLKRRNPDLSVDSVLKIDEDRRKIQFELDNLRATRKTESNKIGALKKDGVDTTELQAQIRKMFEFLGHNVINLKRIRHANIDLIGLKKGQIKQIKPRQIKELKAYLNKIKEER